MENLENQGFLDKKRFETFIDAIFAIVMTFLVLEFKVPRIEHATVEQLKESLFELLPLLFCYFVSFFTIVVIWLDHHHLFKYVKYISKTYALINFFFLLTVSALPFTTGFAGEYIYNPFAVAIFNASILIMNISFTWVFAYPMVKKLIVPEGVEELNKKRLIPIVGMIMIIASVPLAFVNTILAFGLSLTVLILHIIKRY